MSKNARHRDNTTFPGFRRPTFTPVPEEFFPLARLFPERQLKPLLYVIRRTFGWKKPSDRISLSQFLNGITTKEGKVLDRGCGLSKPKLLDGLRELEAAGLLLVTRRTSATHGDEVNEYQLKLAPEEPVTATGLLDFKAFQAPARPVPVPDELFDILLPDLNATEIRILLFVILSTLGHRQESVTNRQILEGSGAGSSQMYTALRHLLGSNVLTAEHRQSPEKGYAPTTYRLHAAEARAVPETTGAKTRYGKSATPVTPESSPPPSPGNLPGDRPESLPPPFPESLPQPGKENEANGPESSPHKKQHTVKQDNVVDVLMNLGINSRMASELSGCYPAEYIMEKIQSVRRKGARNPAGLLVSAIREDWGATRPALHEVEECTATPVEHQQGPEAEIGKDVKKDDKESLESWRARLLAEHQVDDHSLMVWQQACDWLPKFARKAVLPGWLVGGVMLPAKGDSVVVHIHGTAERYIARREYQTPVEEALCIVLRREVRVTFR